MSSLATISDAPALWADRSDAPEAWLARAARWARPHQADVWLAVGLAAAATAETAVTPFDSGYRVPGGWGVALVAVSALSLMWRHSAVLVAVGVSSAVVVVNAAAGFPVGAAQWPPWIALFSCFAFGGLAVRLAGAAMCVAAVTGYVLLDHGQTVTADLAGVVMCFLIATIGGDAARSRRAFAAGRQARTLGEAREQALAAERVLLTERARLAGELHDALGHTVNVMVLQAGVARRVFEDNPGFARQALVDIENAGRDALGELDRLLRILHPRETDVGGSPDLGDLAALAERIRATGRELDIAVEPVALSPSGSRTSYRIVQEALTNAVRHTRSGRIRARVTSVADLVRIEVFNEGVGFAAPVAGRGLVGMRERARLEGGSFDAGPVDGGFRVLATLPARPDTAS
ncbi:sensor histidine kinase [Frankia gtarii]|uniref:sensor histidine kinase n=1 Tax=Frankia gtarii TaxID=2950102 RepID=UPI0021C12D7A|nr:histidine kinase [Frankia gtarii]